MKTQAQAQELPITPYQHAVRNGVYLWVPDNDRRTAFVSTKIERVVVKDGDGVCVSDNYGKTTDQYLSNAGIDTVCAFPILENGTRSYNQNCGTGYTLLSINTPYMFGNSDLLMMAGWIGCKLGKAPSLRLVCLANMELIEEFIQLRKTIN